MAWCLPGFIESVECCLWYVFQGSWALCLPSSITSEIGPCPHTVLAYLAGCMWLAKLAKLIMTSLQNLPTNFTSSRVQCNEKMGIVPNICAHAQWSTFIEAKEADRQVTALSRRTTHHKVHHSSPQPQSNAVGCIRHMCTPPPPS